MADIQFGVTPKGFVLKRLDDIIDEINDDLLAGLGFDPAVNPQSYIGVLVASFANQVARVWEVGQDNYYSMYPSSANDVNLDNAMQFGGVFRETDERTKYILACSGIDGTEITFGAVVESAIPPVKGFQCVASQKITSQGFRAVTIGVISIEANTLYTMAINSSTYHYTSTGTPTILEILQGLSANLLANSAQFAAEVDQTDEDNPVLVITDTTKNSTNAVALSSNLMVVQVMSNISFESLEFGNLEIPMGTITNIVSTISGWESVTNDIAPVSGRLRQGDDEARLSYYERQSHSSTNMLESIISSLYNNVAGIITATGMENDKDEVDEFGLTPHSVWIVVDGGDPGKIAEVIFAKKAGGINTNGAISISVPDAYGNLVPIRFSRPAPQYVWLTVTLYRTAGVTIPANFEELTKATIMTESAKLKPGQTIQLQKFYNAIYDAIPGIDLIDMKGVATESTTPDPEKPYTNVNIPLLRVQKALFDESRIEVILA